MPRPPCPAPRTLLLYERNIRPTRRRRRPIHKQRHGNLKRIATHKRIHTRRRQLAPAERRHNGKQATFDIDGANNADADAAKRRAAAERRRHRNSRYHVVSIVCSVATVLRVDAECDERRVERDECLAGADLAVEKADGGGGKGKGEGNARAERASVAAGAVKGGDEGERAQVGGAKAERAEWG